MTVNMHKDVPPVPFGQSTEAMRAEWHRERWAYLREHGVDALPRVGIMEEVAYAYAIGWADGKHGGAEGDYEAWDRAATMALQFGAEYGRQEYLWATQAITFKHGYGLVWEDVVRMHDLEAVRVHNTDMPPHRG